MFAIVIEWDNVLPLIITKDTKEGVTKYLNGEAFRRVKVSSQARRIWYTKITHNCSGPETIVWERDKD